MSGNDLFYALSDLAKKSFDAGQIEKAEMYANRLLKEASQYRSDWNYGNAVFYGNFVLGRVALNRGDIELADQYLLASGKTPGSPQLDSFGPNMTLAKDLLAKGESDSVLQYLDLCKNFWEGERQQLDAWRNAIRGGKIPDFGYQPEILEMQTADVGGALTNHRRGTAIPNFHILVRLVR
jgi:hypothetical protein